MLFGLFSLAVGIVGSGFSALAAAVAYFVKKNEDAQDRQIERLDDAVVQIQNTLARYETHIGAGDEDLAAIRTDLRDHVTKEEQIFWKKVDAISEAQQIFAQALLQRMTSIEARMPNGEIKELVVSVAELRTEMRAVAEISRAADRHIEEHNAEAEEWKRRIMALEAVNDRARRTR
jgi:hypothetical protein